MSLDLWVNNENCLIEPKSEESTGDFFIPEDNKNTKRGILVVNGSTEPTFPEGKEVVYDSRFFQSVLIDGKEYHICQYKYVYICLNPME